MFGIISGAIGLVTGAFAAVTGLLGGALGTAFVGVIKNIILNDASLILLLKNLFSVEDDEEIEDMGNRVLQGNEQGIKMDDYDNFEEYQAALKGMELDPERSKEIKPEEKEIAGVAFYLKKLEIDYNFGIDGIAELVENNKELQVGTKLSDMIKAIKNINFSETDVLNYYNGKLSYDDMDKFEEILSKVLDK